MTRRGALHPEFDPELNLAFNPDWIVPEWPVASRVRAFVTTRAGGVSAAPYDGFNLGTRCGDDPAAVAANRAQLRTNLPSEPVWLRQVHGARVVDAVAIIAQNVLAEPEADGAYAHTAGVVCAVLVADCMPVLLSDRAGTAVAVAHAGWRGLSGGIIEAAVAAMNAPPSSVVAWLGPAIGPQQFEVGEDVLQACTQRHAQAASAFKPYAGRPRKWLCDLDALARLRLAALGVTAVYGGGYCTVSDPRFYSFRRDQQTGRMGAFIWLEPDQRG